MSVFYSEETKRLQRVLNNWLDNFQRTEKLYNVLIEMYNDVTCYEMDIYGILNELTIDDLRSRLLNLERQLYNKYGINGKRVVLELFPTMLDVEFYLKVLGESLKRIIDMW